MALTYIVAASAAGTVDLFDSKEDNEPNGSFLTIGDVVILDPDNEENDQDWVFVTFEENASTEGFMEVKYLREPVPGDTVRLPVNEAAFVRSCGRAELASVSSAGDHGPPVLADYLIAWAHLESRTDTEPFSNLTPDFAGTDAEGPFRISSEEWSEYQAAASASGVEISNFERTIPNSQASGAAFKALRDAKAFTKLMQPSAVAADGPFIPSYLNVLHCQLLGTKAAFQFQKLKNENLGSKLVTEALEDVLSATKAKTVLSNRSKFLFKDGDPLTVNLFFEFTSQELAAAFKKALSLIRTHADFLLAELGAFDGVPPWFTLAQTEMKEWQDKGLKESAGEGLQKVIRYFQAVNYDTDKNEPWCGAFVGYCLSECNPTFKSTLVKGGATAANWMKWGDTNLRQFDLRDIPKGAIVVTHPMSEGTSGHVGFAVGKVTGTEKIEVLGGNQSDRITIEHIHKNKIRHIRWHSQLSKKKNFQLGLETDEKLALLLELISRKESNGNYNAHYGNAGNQNPKFTAMTVQQVRDWQDNFVKVLKKKSAAVGKYQIIRTTMGDLVNQLGLNGTETFDESLQDKMAQRLLRKRHFDDFVANNIGITQFGNNLSMEWAALPVLSNLTNHKGRKIKRGQSFYAGDGLNKAHIMPGEVEEVLAKTLALFSA